MATVKVIKQAGETGLRLPGSLFSCSEAEAQYFAKLGIVEILGKEQKTPIETKQLKTKRTTKAKNVS